jgi:hypothetical protein
MTGHVQAAQIHPLRTLPRPGLGPSLAQELVAHDDVYGIPFGISLEVDPFGVLENDTLDGEPAGEAGAHAIAWDGRDDHGNDVSAGAYFGRLVVRQGGQEDVLTQKMVVIR